jgi:hypothetical protein
MMSPFEMQLRESIILEEFLSYAGDTLSKRNITIHPDRLRLVIGLFIEWLKMPETINEGLMYQALEQSKDKGGFDA